MRGQSTVPNARNMATFKEDVALDNMYAAYVRQGISHGIAT